ncbi:MAG TPA: M28 family peptidase [Gemmatimonadaceae bacterium]|nr:M28 family peptidase [Gemmatimonadaceae bacterium]
MELLMYLLSFRAPFARLIAILALGAPRFVCAQSATTRELPLHRAPEPTTAAITPADLMTRLYIFSDDSMQGRRVGTEGHRRGTAYIEREVRRLGLVPAGDSGGYFQNLPVFERTLAAGQSLTVAGNTFKPWVDYLPRDNGPTARDFNGAPVVYGGAWGDTATMISPVQAAGKFIVITVPDGPDGSPRWQVNRPALTQYYADAKAIAIASLDAMDKQSRQILNEPNVGLRSPEDRMPAVPAFLYVSRAMTDALLGAPARGLTRGKSTARNVSGSMRFTDAPAAARNVVAVLPGSDPALRGQYIAIGAHNDHIGFNHDPVDHDSLRAFNAVVRPGGEDDPPRAATPEELTRVRAILDSLRRIHPPRLDSIYNGADDDGSGTVALLEIAESLVSAPTKSKRSILFIWHAGEEEGLWGSEYFTDHPTVPRDSIVTELNMDMIGRGGAGDVKGGGAGYLQLIGSRRLSTELGDLIETVAKTEPTSFHFDYQFDANGHPQQYYCRSDHYEYARYGIPIAFFSTGGHRDYHQVTDEAEYIDYDQLARVATLVRDVAVRAANLDHRLVVDKKKPDPHGQCVQ